MEKKWLCKDHAEAHRKAYKPTKVLKWLDDNKKDTPPACMGRYTSL